MRVLRTRLHCPDVLEALILYLGTHFCCARQPIPEVSGNRDAKVLYIGRVLGIFNVWILYEFDDYCTCTGIPASIFGSFHAIFGRSTSKLLCYIVYNLRRLRFGCVDDSFESLHSTSYNRKKSGPQNPWRRIAKSRSAILPFYRKCRNLHRQRRLLFFSFPVRQLPRFHLSLSPSSSTTFRLTNEETRIRCKDDFLSFVLSPIYSSISFFFLIFTFSLQSFAFCPLVVFFFLSPSVLEASPSTTI